MVGSFDLIHQLFNWLDSGARTSLGFKFGLFLGKDARQTPIRTCRLLRQCTVSDATRIKREGSVTTILTGSEAIAAGQLHCSDLSRDSPKVFIATSLPRLPAWLFSAALMRKF